MKKICVIVTLVMVVIMTFCGKQLIRKDRMPW
jgi:hypothetical protein